MKTASHILKSCAVLLLLATTLSCFAACGKAEKEVDYVSQLTLDMSSDTLKQEVTIHQNIDIF